MVAPKGNKFWMARSSNGRNPKFISAAQLWEACLEYFEWVEKNPLKEQKVFCSQGSIHRATVNKMRAMTISGLCLFIDVSPDTWRVMKANDIFSSVIQRAEQIIYDQKFTGAAADLLNANIIARELGLAEKREVKQTVTDLIDEEIEKRVRELSDAQSQSDAKAGTPRRKKAPQ